MKRLPFKDLPKFLQRQQHTLSLNETLRVLTFKKDRYLQITRISDTEPEFRIAEHGFLNQTLDIAADDLKRALKPVILREFPRSNMVWLSFFKEQASLF